MANMIPISTVTVGSGGASSIDFTNIPQNYTDLIIKLSARRDATSTSVDLTFNGSTSGYSRRRILGDGSTASSTSSSSASTIQDPMSVQSDWTSSTFGNVEIYIPNYAGSNNKSISIDAVTENNATTAYAVLNAGLWANTSSITSIKLAPASGNFVQYSSATLYGIRKY